MKQSALQPLLADHDELVKRIEALRQWWEELDEFGRPKFGEMGDHIADFRDALAAHFADEERGGYLRLALEATPELKETARALRRQHPQLLADTDALIECLKACDPPVECWGDARQRFEMLVDAVRRHETAENMLIRQAMHESGSPSELSETQKPR